MALRLANDPVVQRRSSCHILIPPTSAPKGYAAEGYNLASPRFLGTAERFFHVRAVIGCHIGGKGRPSMC